MDGRAQIVAEKSWDKITALTAEAMKIIARQNDASFAVIDCFPKRGLS